jgi:hypothetical protein
LAVLSWPYIDARAGNYERKNQGTRKQSAISKSAKNQGARERKSANAKEWNLRLKKERKSASTKSFARERESANAKTRKERVPNCGNERVFTMLFSLEEPTCYLD